MIELDNIYNVDCLQGMKEIDNESVDMILCDLPYNTIAAKWDKLIPSDELWSQYRRITKKTAA
ncbi:MAG: site-specific DNA-methyltransferase, partial [Bacteroidales bacterium]|nr:site-specific DNA-methyltransferase [Bacteroidales bacterium]